MRIDVAFAKPDLQALVAVELPSGATVRAAIEASGLLERFPEIDLDRNRVGVFGRLTGLDAPLVEGDRVEIYRPLAMDPKEARRRRAARGRTMRDPDNL